MKYPNFVEEEKLKRKGYSRIAGIDEAGRGPLAGPVVASAVVLIMDKNKVNISSSGGAFTPPCGEGSSLPSNPHYLKPNRPKGRGSQIIKDILKEVKDSKKLSAKKRKELYKILIKNPKIEWGIGIVSEKMIDRINIKNAAELAMEKAVKKLRPKPDFLIIDGNHLSNHKLKTTNYKLIVRADEKVFSCAAASIIAKVTRDRIMERYDKKYPQYGFKIHKGYPTKAHLKTLKKYGPSSIHRKTFYPISSLVKR